MKALSLHQPWASLLVHGRKQVETRGWPLHHCGRLLIHAAKHWTPETAETAVGLFFRPQLEDIGVEFEATEAAIRRGWNLPFGAIVGSVEVVDCFRTEDVRLSFPIVTPNVVAGERWRKLDLGMREYAFGDYSPGRFAFLCRNAVAFTRPVPCRGRQGLFTVDEAILKGAE